jgi:hypothetical protein
MKIILDFIRRYEKDWHCLSKVFLADQILCEDFQVFNQMKQPPFTHHFRCIFAALKEAINHAPVCFSDRRRLDCPKQDSVSPLGSGGEKTRFFFEPPLSHIMEFVYDAIYALTAHTYTGEQKSFTT